MRKHHCWLIVVALIAFLATPIMAAEVLEGVVEEITITIKTDEGTKTYTVDPALELDDIEEGDAVKFVVEDDEIELIKEFDMIETDRKDNPSRQSN